MDGSLNVLLICSLVANGNDETCVFLSNFCITVSRVGVRGEALGPAVSGPRAERRQQEGRGTAAVREHTHRRGR